MIFRMSSCFRNVEKNFIFDVILRHYNFDFKIVIEIDVFDYVLDEILSQYD